MHRHTAQLSGLALRLRARIAQQTAVRSGPLRAAAALPFRPAQHIARFSTSSSDSSSSNPPSEADMQRMLNDLQARMDEEASKQGLSGGKGDEAMPDLAQLMAEMEKMGIKPEDLSKMAEAGAGEAGANFTDASPFSSAPSQDLSSSFSPKAKEGSTETLSFQTETRQILDIMTNSLYTDHEVFMRELISNASDALEKLRFMRTSSPQGEKATIQTRPLSVRIHTDEKNNLLVIQDNGIGMTAEELKSHLGVIARSGSKAFMKELAAQGDGSSKPEAVTNIIGQFGVGFYSVFMVADKVEVLSQSSKLDPATGKPYPAYLWSSDGSGSYTLSEVESTGDTGTAIKIYLKSKFKEFAQTHTISGIVQKYSNFVGFPIELNGEKLNTVGAIWLDPKDSVTEEQHTNFYRFISPGSYDNPTYTLHFHVDAPLSIHGLFYFPERHMEKYGMGRMEPGASLYSRKVLIKPKSKELLPEWLRFVRGVADSEDIPLNISRENMQDSRLIQKISAVLVRKILKFLEEEAKNNPEKYNKWYEEFGNFLKEGVCTEYRLSSDIARLLRFESSATKAGETISLDEYLSRMQPEQKSIYFLSTPSRSLAESSPYFESFKSQKMEVLFLYHNIDEFVMNSLQQYNKRKLVSIEKAEAGAELAEAENKKGGDKKTPEVTPDTADVIAFMNEVLGDKVSTIRVTTRLVNSPAAIFDHESAAVRRLMKMMDTQGTVEKGLPRQKLEINPAHPLLKSLPAVKRSNPAMARLLVEQLFDNCLIAADMLDQPRSMLDRLNKLLETTANSVVAAQGEAAPAKPALEEVEGERVLEDKKEKEEKQTAQAGDKVKEAEVA